MKCFPASQRLVGSQGCPGLEPDINRVRFHGDRLNSPQLLWFLFHTASRRHNGALNDNNTRTRQAYYGCPNNHRLSLNDAIMSVEYSMESLRSVHS